MEQETRETDVLIAKEGETAEGTGEPWVSMPEKEFEEMIK